MVTKRYATGLALLIMAVCSGGPIWLDFIVLCFGCWMVWKG